MLAQSPEGSLRRRKATDEDGPGFGTCIGSRHDHRLPRTAAQAAWTRAPGLASRTDLYLRGTGGHRGKKKRGWTIRAQYEADGVAGQYPRSDVGGVLGSRWGWPPGRAGLIRGVEGFTSSNVVHRAMRQATSATPTQAQSHVASTSPKEVRSDLTVNRSLIDVQQGFFQGKMRGSEAPRRFGFCSVPERGATIAIRCRSKAPSPLRYACALQRSAGLRPPASFVPIHATT